MIRYLFIGFSMLAMPHDRDDAIDFLQREVTSRFLIVHLLDGRRIEGIVRCIDCNATLLLDSAQLYDDDRIVYSSTSFAIPAKFVKEVAAQRDPL